MFGRKPKTPAEQPDDRRRVSRGGTTPAFSYYTSRISEPTADSRPPIRRSQPERLEKQPSARKVASKAWLAKVPFWIFVAVIMVCAIKVLTLSNDPKVIIVGGTQAANSYMQPASVYANAAQKLLSSSVVNRSKLTVNASAVSNALQSEFPELLDVSVTIPLVSSRPVVYVQPERPALVLRSLNGDYALNNEGVVLSRVRSLPSGVQLAVDQSGLTPQLGKQVLSGDTVSFVQSVAYQFSAAHLSLSTFVLPAGAPYEVDARLEGKPYAIRFNLEEDVRTQSGAAIATVQQLGSTTPANYLDVRVPGRVYYK